jgi:hypothetical protein
VQVVQLSSLMILCQREENQFLVNCAPKVFQPIELTEEVLLKIGFKKVELVKNKLYKYYKKICIDNYSYILDFRVIPKDEHIGLHIIKDENEDDEVDYYSEVFYSDNIKYLHQLQNAYYLLTGQELNIEL